MKKIIKKIILISSFGFCLGLIVFLPRAASAAVLYISPTSGTYEAGSTFTVSVLVDSQGVAVNAAQAIISFSQNNLKLLNVQQGSTFYFGTPDSLIKNASSTVFSGALPSPGYTGNAGFLGTMTFKAVSAGNAEVSVANGKTLLNDGIGTDVFSGSAGAIYKIIKPSGGASSQNAIEAPKIFSPTNPSENIWYSSNKAEFDWTRPDNTAGFSYAFDQNPDTVPSNQLDSIAATSKFYNNVPEGISYFHIKGKSSTSNVFSKVSHYKIQIDTKTPRILGVSLANNENPLNVSKTPTVQFSAEDPISGISRYEIYLDNNLIESSAASPYKFNSVSPGIHVIKVVAYNLAQNPNQQELPIMIRLNPNGLQAQTANSGQLTPANIFAGTAILLLFLILIFMFYSRSKSMAPQAEIAAKTAQLEAEVREAMLQFHQYAAKSTAKKKSPPRKATPDNYKK